MTMPNITPDAVMFILFFAIVAGVALPFSSFFDRVFTGDVPRNTGSCRRTINKLIGTSLDRDKRQRDYSQDTLIFNDLGLIILLILLFLQGFLLFNSQNFRIFDLFTAINTAIRFVNNTNWQFYSGETVVSYLIHMVYFTVQNFLSSTAGICIPIAVMREITRQYTDQIGNFCVDFIRSTSTCYMKNPER
jgi:potassium-transporting ATPase potassium-binding subunit